MKRKMTAAVATAVLVATSSLALAQLDDKRGASPPAVRSAPAQRPAALPRVQQAPRVQQVPRVQQAPRVQRPAITQPRQPQTAPQRRAMPQQERRAMPQQALPRERVEPRRSVEERARIRDRRERAAEPRRPRDTAPQQVEPRRMVPEQQGVDRPGIADRPDDQRRARDRTQPGGRQPVSRASVSEEQRRIVRERLVRERVGHISRSGFGTTLSVGSRVPRRHRLHRLTPAILALAPIYYGYSYLVVDDTVCIVDPDTYTIVDVLPATIERAEGPLRPALALSPEEMRFVYANVPKDMARADLRVRLGLGAAIPPAVEIFAFPGPVIDHVPQVERYRYVVVDTDVVIVDPEDRAVVLVIPE